MHLYTYEKKESLFQNFYIYLLCIQNSKYTISQIIAVFSKRNLKSIVKKYISQL